jgi:hypothetical protein
VVSEKIFETPQQNVLKLGKKHLWKVLSKECTFYPNPLTNIAAYRRFLFLIGRFLKIFSSEITYSGRRTPSDGKSSHCLWQGE